MEELDWKQRLIPGDNVIVRANSYHPKIQKVERVIKTQIILDTGDRYSKTTGDLIGCSGLTFQFIKKATFEEMMEIRESVKRRSLINKLKNTDYSKLSLETLVDLTITLDKGRCLEITKDIEI